LFERTHDRHGGIRGSGEHLQDAEFTLFEIYAVGEGAASIYRYTQSARSTQSAWLSYGGIRFPASFDGGRRMLEL
jgi:hypothetical protein